MEASASWEKELKLAAETVKMKAEVDRRHAELGLRAARQHRAWNGKWAYLVVGGCPYVFFRFVSCCFVLRNRYLVSSIRNTTSSHNMYLGSSSSLPPSSLDPSPSPARSGPSPSPSRAHSVERWRLSLLKLPCYPRASFRVAQFLQIIAFCTRYTDTGKIPVRLL